MTQTGTYAVGGLVALVALAGGLALAAQSDEQVGAPSSSKSALTAAAAEKAEKKAEKESNVERTFRDMATLKGPDGEPMMVADTLKAALEAAGVRGITEKETKTLLRRVDPDGKGVIGLRDFEGAVKKAPEVMSETVSAMSQQEVAQVYDRTREEVQEIARIKNDFIAKLEKAGRQSTLRLQTMGGTPIPGAEAEADAHAETAAESGGKGDSMPEEVFLRTTPMNLAKRNAIEANRRQWGIGYDPKKPERVDGAQMSSKK